MFQRTFAQVRKYFKKVRKEPCRYVGGKHSRQMKQPVQRPWGRNSKEASVATKNEGGESDGVEVRAGEVLIV